MTESATAGGRSGEWCKIQIATRTVWVGSRPQNEMIFSPRSCREHACYELDLKVCDFVCSQQGLCVVTCRNLSVGVELEEALCPAGMITAYLEHQHFVYIT